MPETGKLQAAPAHPCLCVVLTLSSPQLLPGSQRHLENMPRITQWLLGVGVGGEIVNVLVPFTKPQPKRDPRAETV